MITGGYLQCNNIDKCFIRYEYLKKKKKKITAPSYFIPKLSTYDN